jgi:2-polyprenyl-6-hydroxyphenyl methylase/3-demethylubiquinone-9 3-methyltransferase
MRYKLVAAEDMAAAEPGQFDVVTCMEMLEHVPDPAAIVRAAATLVKPGGRVFFSTLNRNVKSYLFAVIGAEYVAQMLPKGTHDYARFIRPSELAQYARAAGLREAEIKGITYRPLGKHFALSDDTSVNYLFACRREP